MNFKLNTYCTIMIKKDIIFQYSVLQMPRFELGLVASALTPLLSDAQLELLGRLLWELDSEGSPGPPSRPAGDAALAGLRLDDDDLAGLQRTCHVTVPVRPSHLLRL
jgi:hypothetical protein